MKDNWEVKKLGELLQRTETVNPTLNPEQEFIYVDVSSVSNKIFEIESVNVIKGKDAPSRARKLIKTGDVIFATVRPTLRRISIIPAEYNNQVCSTGYFVLRAKENICNSLIFYYLLTDSFNERMEKLQKGASYPAVTDSEVREQIIHYPTSLAEQQRIVAILDEAFAAIAQAKENAEKNLQNARELFDSYLQSVFANPGDGWEEKTLGEVLQKTETVDPTKNPDKEFIYIDVSSVNKENLQIESTTLLKGKDAPSRARKLIKTNDVIFATVRPTLKRIAVIPEEYNEQVCSTGYFVLRAKENLENKLVFYFLQTNSFNEKMEKLQKGASYPAVTDGEVRSQVISYPKSLAEQKAIVYKLDTLSAETKKLENIYRQKINDLDELKKSVLQKAFSGELTAKRQVSNVVGI